MQKYGNNFPSFRNLFCIWFIELVNLTLSFGSILKFFHQLFRCLRHLFCFFYASECNCNGHSDRCTFDPAVYEANGGISGGVCLDCQHNTMGRNCQQCRDMFYQDPYQDIRSSTICKRTYYMQGGIIIARGFGRNTPPLPSPPQIFYQTPTLENEKVP